jgi:hypothetical protein
MAVARRLVAQCTGHETLAGAGLAQHQHVVMLRQPATAGQALHQRPIQSTRLAIVDVFQARCLAQSRQAQPLRESGVVPIDLLPINQHRQTLVEAEPSRLGLPQPRLQGARHAAQTQRAEFLNRLMQHHYPLS